MHSMLIEPLLKLLRKDLGDTIRFAVANLYNIEIKKRYEGLFGGFVWSHILIQNLNRLLKTIDGFLPEDGLIVFMENNFVNGSNPSIASTNQFRKSISAKEI